MRRLPSLTALRFFEESARHASFNKSAAALCVTPGAVSRQIRLLEESLGTRLFERDHQGVRLTHQGAELLASVSQALDSVERATHALTRNRRALRRQLTVCAPPTFATRWLPPRLGSLMNVLPDVMLTVRIDDIDACDCVIRFERSTAARPRSQLLYMERHLLVGAARLRGQKVSSLLQTLPTLHVLHDGSRLNLWQIWLEAAGLETPHVNEGIEFSTLDQAIHAARAGTGLAVVDRNMIEDELRDGSLVALSTTESHGPYGYWLDVPEAQRADDHIEALVQWLRAEGAKASGSVLDRIG